MVALRAGWRRPRSAIGCTSSSKWQAERGASKGGVGERVECGRGKKEIFFFWRKRSKKTLSGWLSLVWGCLGRRLRGRRCGGRS